MLLGWSELATNRKATAYTSQNGAGASGQV
jgi:hypothetical protein